MLYLRNMPSAKRIRKELDEVMTSAISGASACPKGDSLFDWTATIVGPEGTPYAGGVFHLDITFPSDYPFRAPVVKFVTPIYHCNVSESGLICLDILKDKWSPVLTISKVLLSISSLMSDPNPDDPLRPEIAEILRSNKKHHDELASLETLRYAT